MTSKPTRPCFWFGLPFPWYYALSAAFISSWTIPPLVLPRAVSSILSVRCNHPLVETLRLSRDMPPTPSPISLGTPHSPHILWPSCTSTVSCSPSVSNNTQQFQLHVLAPRPLTRMSTWDIVDEWSLIRFSVCSPTDIAVSRTRGKLGAVLVVVARAWVQNYPALDIYLEDFGFQHLLGREKRCVLIVGLTGVLL